MVITKARLRRCAVPAAFAVGAALGVYQARELFAYGVPASVAAASVLTVSACVYVTVRQFLEALLAETHRCRVEGCTFRARLTCPDAGESRRWQEIAAAHPAHDRHWPVA
ncbi:hypothetical protein ACH4UT_27840 [Streptomyces sp. NPDC020799]|uniref:hypothetical protein n=1 Tax=Streptomyces sp. NPDC020799 TaxID=3365091 RepID=UPI0037ABD5E4